MMIHNCKHIHLQAHQRTHEEPYFLSVNTQEICLEFQKGSIKILELLKHLYRTLHNYSIEQHYNYSASSFKDFYN